MSISASLGSIVHAEVLEQHQKGRHQRKKCRWREEITMPCTSLQAFSHYPCCAPSWSCIATLLLVRSPTPHHDHETIPLPSEVCTTNSHRELHSHYRIFNPRLAHATKKRSGNGSERQRQRTATAAARYLKNTLIIIIFEIKCFCEHRTARQFHDYECRLP